MRAATAPASTSCTSSTSEPRVSAHLIDYGSRAHLSGPSASAPPGAKLFSWFDSVYACASPRIFWLAGEGPHVVFPAGVRPIRRVGGRNYMAFAGSRTNIALQNRAIDVDGAGNPWNLINSATVTADVGGGPVNDASADQLNIADHSLSGVEQGFAAVSFDDDLDIVASLFHWHASGSANWRHQLGGKFGAGGAGTNIAATTTVQRYRQAMDMGSGVATPFHRIRRGGDAGARQIRYDLHQWEGSGSSPVYFASEPIATTTSAVTRAAGIVTIPAALYRPSFLQHGWTVRVRLDPASGDVQTGEEHVLLFRGASEKLSIINDSGTLYVRVVSSAGAVQRAFTTADPQQALTITVAATGITVAGATTGNGATAGTIAPWSSGTLYAGATSTPDNYFFGSMSEPERVAA